MDKYKIYREDNYIIVVNTSNSETQYGFTKEVFIDKSNINIPSYRIFNVRDFDENNSLSITQILKEDGSTYTQSEFETFYKQNTGNFSQGSSSPGIESVTGSSVDNTDPQNPIILSDDSKLDKGGYTGDAQDLKTDIDNIYQPNTLISAVSPTRVSNTFTYTALGVEALINKIRYKNPTSYSTTITPAATDFKRVDVIYIGANGTMGTQVGTEVSTTNAPMPNIPPNTVMVGFVNINGANIENVTPITKKLSFLNAQGVKVFETEDMIKIKGATLNASTQTVEINPIVSYTIFVDTVNGNDSKAVIQDASSPFKTTQAAYNAIPNDGQLYTLLYVDSGVTRDMSAPFPPSNRRWEIKSNNTGVFDFTNKVNGTTYSDSIWLNANINAPKSTIKFDIKGSQKLFINGNGTDVNIIADRMEVTASIAPSGAAVRGLIYTTTYCNITLGTLYTNFASPGLAPIVLATHGKFTINTLWDCPVSVRMLLFTPANLGITNEIEIYINKFKRADISDEFGFINGAVKKLTIGDVEGINSLYLIKVVIGITNPFFTTEIVFNNTKVVNAQLTLVSGSTGEFSFTGKVASGLVSMYHQGNSGTKIILNNFQAKIKPAEYYNSYTTLINTILTFDDYLFTDNPNPAQQKVLLDGQIVFRGNNTLTSLNNNIYLIRDELPNSVLSVEGAVYTNCKAFGLNVKAIYKLATFKEKKQEVVVRYKTDLVGRVLDSNMTYIIDGIITLLTGEYIQVPAGGLTIVGYGFDVSQIVKNIAGQSIFSSPSGNSGNFVTKEITYNSGLGSVFNLTDSNGTHAIELNDVNFQSCNSIGNLNGYRQFTGTTCGIYSCSDGFTLDGVWSGFKMTNSNVIGFGASGTLFKKGTTTSFTNRFYIDLNLQIATGSKICDFQESNFVNNKSLQVVNCYNKVNGIVDSSTTSITFPNISPFSPKAYFLNNQGIQNSRYTIENGVSDNEAVAVGQISNTIVTSATTLNLTSTSRVMYYTYTGTTPATWTLPPLAGNSKLRLVLYNTGTDVVTFNTNTGSNDIYDSGTLVNTGTVNPGNRVELFNNSVIYIMS